MVSQSTARTTFAVSDRSASTTSAPASRSSPADERPLATPTERAPPIRAAATSRLESAMYTVASSANSTPYFSAARVRAFSSSAPLGKTSEPYPPISVSKNRSRAKACSFSIAFGLSAPVRRVCTTPASPPTSVTAARAPGSRRPCSVSRLRRAWKADVSSAANRPSTSSPAGAEVRGSAWFRASASKKISDSVRPAICGSRTSGRPVTLRKASAYAARVTRPTSTRVRSMFHRTRR